MKIKAVTNDPLSFLIGLIHSFNATQIASPGDPDLQVHPVSFLAFTLPRMPVRFWNTG